MIVANIIESAFGPLIDVFKQVLIGVHHVVGGSWGWAIIGLTVVIRIVTLPVMIKQFRSMAKMLVHQPELKKIQARYKDDKQRLNEEMMKYYKENGVNPLASCLPLLIQLPVFISLFYMLRTDLKHQICGPAIVAKHISAKALTNIGCSTIKPHSGSFLFIHDITAKATGVALVVLIVLYMSSMFLTSYLSTATMERNQRIMMLALPLVFTVIILRYPSELLVYWITTNLTQIPLQYFVRRRVGTPPPATAVAASAGGGGGGNGRAAPRAARAALSKTPARSGGTAGERTATVAPRQPPRKRKKRSGRRR